MAKSASIEQQLQDLSACRSDPASAASQEKLTKALSGKSNAVAGKAATLITDFNQAGYLPAIAATFERFFTAGDKGCLALTQLANALYTFGHTDSIPFLRGIHHYQPEAGFGPPVDVAIELRGICALGLVRQGYPDVLTELAELLMDPEPQARQMAARAIAYAGHESGAMLLRMKVLAGDKDPDVIAESFTALMKVAPRKSLPFVGKYLKSLDATLVEAAAIAIGSSKLPEAFSLLKSEWEAHVTPGPRRPLLLAIAMTRQPPAVEFLMERVAEDRPAAAADAVAALAMYKHEDAVRSRLAGLVKDLEDLLITAAFEKAFGHS
jgi:HEAT repeat protein